MQLCDAAGTLPVERTEPSDTPSSQRQEDRWYGGVQRECRCEGSVKCGFKYRQILQQRRAYGAFTHKNLTRQKRVKLLQLRCRLRKLQGLKASCHMHAASPTQDVLRMPRELLPSAETVCTADVSQWPYLTRATINDVKAMMLVKYRHKDIQQLQAAWQTLRTRMHQYAVSGRGTVAEAIVHNEHYWLGHQDRVTVMKFLLSNEFEEEATGLQAIS
jgi:hypothetical protein